MVLHHLIPNQRCMGDIDDKLPQHERLLALLDSWQAEPGDKSPEWWQELDAFMRDNRPTFPIPVLLDDESDS